MIDLLIVVFKIRRWELRDTERERRKIDIYLSIFPPSPSSCSSSFLILCHYLPIQLLPREPEISFRHSVWSPPLPPLTMSPSRVLPSAEDGDIFEDDLELSIVGLGSQYPDFHNSPESIDTLAKRWHPESPAWVYPWFTILSKPNPNQKSLSDVLGMIEDLKLNQGAVHQ